MAEEEKTRELSEEVDDFLIKELERVDAIRDEEKRQKNLETFERLYKTHMQAQTDLIRVNNEIFKRENERELEKAKLEYQKEIDEKNSKLKIWEIVAKVLCGAVTATAGIAYANAHTNKVLKFSETGTLGNIESSLLRQQGAKIPEITITHF